MYQPINGFTKAKILEVLKARPLEGPAIRDEYSYTCAYKGKDGNRCAVGMFIPDGHDGESYEGSVGSLLERYPDLMPLMPLQYEGLKGIQLVHDQEQGNAKAAMIDWVEKNVQDDAA